MMEDLRADSANFERSGDRGTPSSDGFGFGPNPSPNFSIGKYEDSMIHRSRQHWGPSATQQPAAPEPSTERVPSRAPDTPFSGTSSTSHQSGSTYSDYQRQAQGGFSGGGTAPSPAGSNYTHYASEQPSNSASTYQHYPAESSHGRTATHYDNAPQATVPRSTTTQQHGYPGTQATQGSAYGTSRYFGSHNPGYLVYH
jgi:hypothetical protein